VQGHSPFPRPGEFRFISGRAPFFFPSTGRRKIFFFFPFDSVVLKPRGRRSPFYPGRRISAFFFRHRRPQGPFFFFFFFFSHRASRLSQERVFRGKGPAAPFSLFFFSQIFSPFLDRDSCSWRNTMGLFRRDPRLFFTAPASLFFFYAVHRVTFPSPRIFRPDSVLRFKWAPPLFRTRDGFVCIIRSRKFSSFFFPLLSCCFFFFFFRRPFSPPPSQNLFLSQRGWQR